MKKKGFLVHKNCVYCKNNNNAKDNKLKSHGFRQDKKEKYFRIIAGVLFFLSIFIFLHFKQIKVDSFELNSVANRYLVSQVDFEYPDEEATFVAKQKILNNVGDIYRLDEKIIEQAGDDFEKFLLVSMSCPKEKRPVLNKTWRQLEKKLLDARFCDSKTYNLVKEYQLKLPDISVNNSVVKARGINGLGFEDVKFIAKKILEDKIDCEKEAMPILEKYISGYNLYLILDTAAQNQLKQAIEKTIPPTLKAIRAGEQIVRQGDLVTLKHLSMTHSMKETLNKSYSFWDGKLILSNLFLSFIFTLTTFVFLAKNLPKTYSQNKKLFLLITIVVINMLFAKGAEYFLIISKGKVFQNIYFPVLAPLSAIFLNILVNYQLASFIAFLVSIIFAIGLSFDPLALVVINFSSALIFAYKEKEFYKRKDIFLVCIKSFGIAAMGILAFILLGKQFFSYALFINLSFAFVTLLLISVVVIGFLPIFEYLFDEPTNISLVEYMDPNNELLSRLAKEIPGTYQHSVVLGHLAETAAKEIGANSLLCRIATLYHDVGKLNNSAYYIENQQEFNIHHVLKPEESAKIIISHVQDGVELASKHRLPAPFIDIIKEHHGTTLVYFFYHKAQEMNSAPVDEKLFRYPGPKPHTREAAIIMIVDAVEAASRSLKEVSEESLKTMVNKIVLDKAQDGQFDECPITFEELNSIKRSLINNLLLTQHLRVKYPTRKIYSKD